MKQYILKLIFAIFAIIVAYEFTIGKEVKKINQKASFILTKEGRKDGIEKIKKEMRRAIKKENYLDKDERELLKAFINKIQSELK